MVGGVAWYLRLQFRVGHRALITLSWAQEYRFGTGTALPSIERGCRMIDFYGKPEVKEAYQIGFNDGLESVINTALELGYITQEQADDLLSETVSIN